MTQPHSNPASAHRRPRRRRERLPGERPASTLPMRVVLPYARLEAALGALKLDRIAAARIAGVTPTWVSLWKRQKFAPAIFVLWAEAALACCERGEPRPELLEAQARADADRKTDKVRRSRIK